MSLLRLPTTADPFYTFSADLDGTEFFFRMSYNSREDRWYLSVYTAEGSPIALSIKLVTNWPLLNRKAWDPRAPKGVLYVAGVSPPGLNDLAPGARCQLVYLTSDDPLAERLRTLNVSV
jgi:hypothetical protein